MSDHAAEFALGIDPSGSEDLEKAKVYQILQDSEAEAVNMLRVIDKSAEDYLYPADFFVIPDLPQKAREALFVVSSLTFRPTTRYSRPPKVRLASLEAPSPSAERRVVPATPCLLWVARRLERGRCVQDWQKG